MKEKSWWKDKDCALITSGEALKISVLKSDVRFLRTPSQLELMHATWKDGGWKGEVKGEGRRWKVLFSESQNLEWLIPGFFFFSFNFFFREDPKKK